MRLLEILIVLVILGVLGSLGMSAFSNYRANQEMLLAVDVVVGALGTARTQTVASKGASVYGVHFDTEQVILFKGGSYATSSSSNATSSLPYSVTIATTSFAGGGSNVLFKRLTGGTDQHGLVTLHSSNSAIPDRVIEILSTGILTTP